MPIASMIVETNLQDFGVERDVQRIADEEQRTITQVCEMLRHEGVEAYKKEGPKFMQRPGCQAEG